ncbi:MAG: HEAT repeat domain-containing protein [Cyanobium sp.]
MHASLPAALLVLVLSATWLLGRRRSRPFLRSTDTASVVALNRAQIERLRVPSIPAPDPETIASAPGAAAAGPHQADVQPWSPISRPQRPRPQRLLELQAWLVGSREQRLAAVAAARSHGHRDLLPLLRRALRDPDPAVVAAAVAAMERFRGRPAGAGPEPSPAAWRSRPQAGSPAAAPRPRSVSLTR